MGRGLKVSWRLSTLLRDTRNRHLQVGIAILVCLKPYAPFPVWFDLILGAIWLPLFWPNMYFLSTLLPRQRGPRLWSAFEISIGYVPKIWFMAPVDCMTFTIHPYKNQKTNHFLLLLGTSKQSKGVVCLQHRCVSFRILNYDHYHQFSETLGSPVCLGASLWSINGLRTTESRYIDAGSGTYPR